MTTDLMILESPVPDGSSWREHANRIAAYLPLNYEVVPPTVNDLGTAAVVRIAGVDRSGWTALDYVIPRLGSGLIGCKVSLVIPISPYMAGLLAAQVAS